MRFQAPGLHTETENIPSVSQSASKRAQLYELLHNVTDIPLDEFQDEKSLDETGIDSLMVTEVLTGLKSAFSIDIDMVTILSFPTLGAIVTHVDSALGIAARGSEHRVDSEELKPEDTPGTSGIIAPPESSLIDFQEAFSECSNAYDTFAKETKATGFWGDVYPRQRELVLAYTVEAFASLGCNMASLQPGQLVPGTPHQPRYDQLVRQFFRVLEDGDMVTSDNKGHFIRTATPVSQTPAITILEQLLVDYPQHVSVHKLVQATGSELAACLTGQKDIGHLLFGDQATKHYLGDVYENWPLFRSATMVLGRFLEKAFSAAVTTDRQFRILEVGAGTAGTAKYLVHHLLQHGVSFEYVFTDLSSSLVADARRNIFRGMPNMEFHVLDIEKEPPYEWLGTFDVIVSSNCVHATRNLSHSLSTLRRLLRDDGVLALVEITRNMFWLDIVFGLFEGWWLFNDGRKHAVASETRWKTCMLDAGFHHVAWSVGEELEADTVRVVAAFAA